MTYKPGYWDLDPALRARERSKDLTEAAVDRRMADEKRRVDTLYSGLLSDKEGKEGNKSDQLVNGVYDDLTDNEASALMRQPDVDNEPDHMMQPHQVNAGNVLKALDPSVVNTLRESGGGTLGAKDKIDGLTDALNRGSSRGKVARQWKRTQGMAEKRLREFTSSYDSKGYKTKRTIEERTAASVIEAGIGESTNQGDQLNTETPWGNILNTSQTNELNRAVVAAEFLRGVQAGEIDISHLSPQERAWVYGFTDEQFGFGVRDKSNEELAVLGEFLERIGYDTSSQETSSYSPKIDKDNAVESDQTFVQTKKAAPTTSDSSLGIFNLRPNTTVSYHYPKRNAMAARSRRATYRK